MSFTPNIPVSGQTLGQTRAAVNGNFTNYNATISTNHVAPNNAGAGKHTFAEFVMQGSDPATAVNEITTYGKTVAAAPSTNTTELFVRKDNNGSVYQLTFGVPSVAANGWTFLPGGMLLQWGNFTFIGTTLVVTFPQQFPTAALSIQLTANTQFPGSATTLGVFAVSSSNFTAARNSTTGGNLGCYFLAVGN